VQSSDRPDDHAASLATERVQQQQHAGAQIVRRDCPRLGGTAGICGRPCTRGAECEQGHPGQASDHLALNLWL